MLRKSLLLILLMAPPVVTAVVTRINEVPRRFAEVEPGRIYRGGRPTPAQLESLKSNQQIRTVVSLLDQKDTPEERALAETCSTLNLRVIRRPMPGDGRGEFSMLDTAADAVNDPANQPVYFHCAAGKQRSNAVLAAYRMKHCGWTLDKALAELRDDYDLDPETEGGLVEHLTKYARRLGAQLGRDLTAATPDAQLPKAPMRQ